MGRRPWRARSEPAGLVRGSWLGLYLVGVAAGAVLLSVCGLALASAPVAPGSAEVIAFEVEPGEATLTIARRLEREGLIRDELEFRVLAALLGWNGRLKAGHYQLSPGESTLSVLRTIGRGRVTTVAVTIPEGYTLAQIEQHLSGLGLISLGDLSGALAEQDASGNLPFLPTDRSQLAEPFEGLLFPDTYFFEQHTSARVLVRNMVGRTQEVFTEERLVRARELGLSPWEVLTLASIIEKEAVVDEERVIISSVYHNRLKVGMKLDACPTVFYVLGKPMSEPLLFVDLEVESPYNTYRNAGLPPGPICSPGLASIDAALNPADTRYYYFVAKNDGTHHFSRTLDEHNRAVARYLGGS